MHPRNGIHTLAVVCALLGVSGTATGQVRKVRQIIHNRTQRSVDFDRGSSVQERYRAGALTSKLRRAHLTGTTDGLPVARHRFTMGKLGTARAGALRFNRYSIASNLPKGTPIVVDNTRFRTTRQDARLPNGVARMSTRRTSTRAMNPWDWVVSTSVQRADVRFSTGLPR
jgi:hypothetical protein